MNITTLSYDLMKVKEKFIWPSVCQRETMQDLAPEGTMFYSAQNTQWACSEHVGRMTAGDLEHFIPNQPVFALRLSGLLMRTVILLSRLLILYYDSVFFY